jgi:hypothetical protein
MTEMDLVDIPNHPMFANDNTKALATRITLLM